MHQPKLHQQLVSLVWVIGFIERRSAEFLPPMLGRLGAEKLTTGDCWVASQGFSAVAGIILVGTRTSPALPGLEGPRLRYESSTNIY